MKRKMHFVCVQVDGRRFEQLDKLRKELFPRHKYEAYGSKNAIGKMAYTMRINLTEEERKIFLAKKHEIYNA